MSSNSKAIRKQKFNQNGSKNNQKNNNNIIKEKKLNQELKSAAVLGLLKTLERFGTCLNNKTSYKFLSDKYEKVCLMLINSYEDQNKDLGIGPLNDSINVGLYHHKFEYKIFYLYNPQCEEYINYLKYFLQNTTENLTVFFSGLDHPCYGIHEIEFINGRLSSNVLKDTILQNYNGKAKVVFITDSFNGGSVFDIYSIKRSNNLENNKVVSFWVNKNNHEESNEKKRSHGIFIYYFFKIINDNHNISPKDLVNSIRDSILPFNEVLNFDVSNSNLVDSPIFAK